MCKFASFIITQRGEFWAASDKHEDIVSEHCLSDLDKKRPPGIVRVKHSRGSTQPAPMRERGSDGSVLSA